MIHFNIFSILHTESITNVILSLLFIHAGWIDARKYLIQTKKIKEQNTSKGISRRFTNDALYADFIKLIYVIKIVQDLYIITTTILALTCVGIMWYYQYLTYPFRMRGCPNFKRPSVYSYFINSLLSNETRKRL